MDYRAPLRDMRFVLDELAGLRAIEGLPGFEDATDDTVTAVLEECAKLTGEVISPLNRVGDTQPPRWADGAVRTSPGFAKAPEVNRAQPVAPGGARQDLQRAAPPVPAPGHRRPAKKTVR